MYLDNHNEISSYPLIFTISIISSDGPNVVVVVVVVVIVCECSRGGRFPHQRHMFQYLMEPCFSHHIMVVLRRWCLLSCDTMWKCLFVRTETCTNRDCLSTIREFEGI